MTLINTAIIRIKMIVRVSGMAMTGRLFMIAHRGDQAPGSQVPNRLQGGKDGIHVTKTAPSETANSSSRYGSLHGSLRGTHTESHGYTLKTTLDAWRRERGKPGRNADFSIVFRVGGKAGLHPHLRFVEQKIQRGAQEREQSKNWI